MDNNYLYIVGFLGIVLVSFVVFYYFSSSQKTTNKNETAYTNQVQYEKNNEQDVECDGEKCFIKHKQTKYDKCDGEKCL